MPIRQRVADFEKRMNYKAQPLSEEQQNKLDAEFRAAAQLKKWPE
jgi:hypothetical protein